jgi:hypothetical protein
MVPPLKRSLTLLSLALTMGLAGSAFAGHDKPQKPEKPHKSERHAAPEFDGKATGSAAALLLGGVLVLADRRRRHAGANS